MATATPLPVETESTDQGPPQDPRRTSASGKATEVARRRHSPRPELSARQHRSRISREQLQTRAARMFYAEAVFAEAFFYRGRRTRRQPRKPSRPIQRWNAAPCDETA